MPRTGRPKLSRDVEFECRQCGKRCSVPQWTKTGKQFCSTACYHVWRVGKPCEWAKVAPSVKTCPQCGRTFECGGGGRPRRYQVHCSKQCNVASQGYRTECRKLSEIEAAYIAGFIDGEGCVTFYERRETINVKLFAHNCKRVVLDWIAERTGVGSVTRHTPENGNHSESWYWQVNQKAAIGVLRQIREHLRLKQQQADLCIEAYELHEQKLLQGDKGKRDGLLKKIRKLNKRGP